MPKIERPSEPVILVLADGKERVLRYPLSAVKQAGQEFGASLVVDGAEALKNLDENKLPKLIWYGLRNDDKALTPDDVADLIEMRAIPYVMQQFLLAYAGPQPETKNEQGLTLVQAETQKD